MAFVVKDRVKQTSTTTGTTTMVLSGSASVGYQSFSDALSDGDTTVYAITDANGNWETGLGTWESSNDTLTRTTVYESSNSNNAVNFSSGTKNVFITSPASRSAIADQNGKTTFVDNIEVTGINVEDNTDPRISLRNTTANASTVAQIQGDASGTMWLLADGMNQANNSRIVMAVDGLEKFRINGGGSGNGAWGLGGANYGTAGQVITSNGTTSAPTWQTPTVDLSAYSTTSQIASTYQTTSSIASIYAPLLSPNLTGNPTVPTQSANNNSTRIASTEYVDGAVSNLVDSAPSTLNTLNELASALNDDPSFATTITTSIGTKLATADFTTTANTWISSKDTDALSEGSTNLYFTNARVTSAVTGSNLDMGSNDITTTGKLLYANMYANSTAYPNASTYHGCFIHDHSLGAGLFSHAGNWVRLANHSDLSNYLTISSASSTYLAKAGGTLSGWLDLNGNELYLDVDADTSITADTDDRIDFKIGGDDNHQFMSTGSINCFSYHTGNSASPQFKQYWYPSDSSTTAWDYVGGWTTNGLDSAGNSQTWTGMYPRIASATSGSEIGTMELYLSGAGSSGAFSLSQRWRPDRIELMGNQYIEWENHTSTYEYILQTPTTINSARTVTLPDASGTILTTGNADAGTTTTSSSDADHVLINDGGVLKKITPANLGIGSGGGSSTGDISFSGSTITSSGTTVTIDDILSVTGNVGISQTNPSDKLEIQGSGSDGIRLSVSGQSYYHKIRSNGDGLLLSADDSDSGGAGADIRFHVANSEKVRISHDGAIGIGGTNYGSAGQVLTSNGSVSAPSWQTVSGGSSGVSVSDATALAFQLG